MDLIYNPLIILVLIITFFKRPVGKGLLGELIVNIAIKKFLNKKCYHLIKDVILHIPDDSGHRFQLNPDSSFRGISGKQYEEFRGHNTVFYCKPKKIVLCLRISRAAYIAAKY